MFQEYEMSMIVTRSQKEYCFNISDMVFKKNYGIQNYRN